MNEIQTIADPGLSLSAQLTLAGSNVGAALAMSEIRQGLYAASVPAGTPAGIYTVLVLQGSTVISYGPLHWNGNYEVALSDLENLSKELHLVHGLDAEVPLTVSETQRQVGNITQTVTDDGTATTVQRI